MLKRGLQFELLVTPRTLQLGRNARKTQRPNGPLLALRLSVAFRLAAEVKMLQRGDAVPHFEVRTAEGAPFSYSSIWQRKNLLLVTLPTIDSDSTAYMSEVARLRDLADPDLECVITRESIPGVAGSAVVVADRWGEIVYSVAKSDVADLPAPQELVEWVTYLNNQCPECEGEAR